MHACLTEQALNAGDLTLAAVEVHDGLAVLTDDSLPGEKIRLLAAGARVAAELALLPRPARPERLLEQWGQAAATFAELAATINATSGDGQPEVAAFGALAAAGQAREHGSDGRATWRAVAQAWQAAGHLTGQIAR
jgi:hypothetical protein